MAETSAHMAETSAQVIDPRTRQRTDLTGEAERQKRMRIFADKIAQGVEPVVACQYAGIPYSTYCNWRAKRDDFRELLEDAAERRTQMLEREAWRRALAGSDTLLIFMLKAARPGIYRENVSLELSGPGGAPLELGDSARAARILAIMEAAKRDAQTIEHVPAADDIADAEFAPVIEPTADGSELV